MGTLLGFGIAFACVIVSILWAYNWSIEGFSLFVDMASVFCTGGCTIGVIFIAHPMDDIFGLGGLYKKSMNYPLDNPVELIKKLVRYAELARKNGILALDGATDADDDVFMSKGIQLAVDGIDPDQIKETMETELGYMQSRHNAGKRILDNFTKYAPAFGMVGTLIGLIIMLKNLNDVALIGPSMAVALVTTFYGALIANLLCGPVADKLYILDEREKMNKEIIINGVLAIQSGDNPRMVEQKLKVFLPPKLRDAVTTT